MYTVKFREYLCHPETCGHDEHFPWWIMQGGVYYRGFETEEEAVDYKARWLDESR